MSPSAASRESTASHRGEGARRRSSAWGRSSPTPPTRPRSGRTCESGRYAISEVDPGRWDPALYYDPDPHAPEKTYSKIGGWVRDFEWDPLAWKLPMPPKVTDAMDDAQKWAVACTRMALHDCGWPERPLDLDRTAVIIGNALSGEKHYQTALRISFPELARELERASSFAALPADVRAAIEHELRDNVDAWLPQISEDTMPGELSNCVAGGSRTSSTCTDPTSPSTPHAPRRWPRWTPRSRA